MSAFDIDFKALKREVLSNIYMEVVLVIFQMILKKGLVPTEKQQNSVLYNSVKTSTGIYIRIWMWGYIPRYPRTLLKKLQLLICLS